jgi:hypothetical protein
MEGFPCERAGAVTTSSDRPRASQQKAQGVTQGLHGRGGETS